MKDLFLPLVSCFCLLMVGCNKDNSAPDIKEPSPAVNKTIETPEFFDLTYEFVGVGGSYEFAVTADLSTSDGRAGESANTTRTQYFSAVNLPSPFAQYDTGGPYLVMVMDKKESYESEFNFVAASYFSTEQGLVLSHSNDSYDIATNNSHESSREAGDNRFYLGKEDTIRDVTVIYDLETHNEIGSYTSSRKETPLHIETISIGLGEYRVAKFDYSSAYVYEVGLSRTSETATGSYWIEISTGQVIKAEKHARIYNSGSNVVLTVTEKRELANRQSMISTLSADEASADWDRGENNHHGLSGFVSQQLQASPIQF